MESTPINLSVFGCQQCPSTIELSVNHGKVTCKNCENNWDLGPKNCLNSLQNPTDSVLSEINGMRSEQPEKYPSLNDFFYQKVEKVSTLEDRISFGVRENHPKNYYLSTKKNFDYAFSKLQPKRGDKVLEIGAEHDYPFLVPFQKLNCECFATNLYFTYDKEAPIAQPVLADMNHLPFRSNQFDIVILSATSHHSPNLPELMAELARVTKRDGHILLLNDPTKGFFKHTFDWLGLGEPKGGSRAHEVNENEYSARQYFSLARANNLAVVESFFSIYYDEKLQSGKVEGVRLAPVAKFVSLFWRFKAIRKLFMRFGLYFGQMLIGLELNLILRKK